MTTFHRGDLYISKEVDSPATLYLIDDDNGHSRFIQVGSCRYGHIPDQINNYRKLTIGVNIFFRNDFREYQIPNMSSKWFKVSEWGREVLDEIHTKVSIDEDEFYFGSNPMVPFVSKHVEGFMFNLNPDYDSWPEKAKEAFPHVVENENGGVVKVRFQTGVTVDVENTTLIIIDKGAGSFSVAVIRTDVGELLFERRQQ